MVRKYIGLSLSLCIQDILNGEISIDEISTIVSSTTFQSPEESFEAYYTGYWYDFDKDTVKKTLDELWPFVFQPTLQLNHG